MKILILILFYLSVSLAQDTKIYFYTTDVNINNFRSLKTSFDDYFSAYGDYEFQPFSDKKTFEKHLKEKKSILILSSWHYKKICKNYNLEAILVAQKKGSVTDTKILVGKKNTEFKGLLTSAYDKEYTQELIQKLTKTTTNSIPILIVPKEIDALMSVSFGMSSFALVSKDSLEFLNKINPSLTKELHVYEESKPKYRILLANNQIEKNKHKIITMFNNMDLSKKGKDILNSMGIDKLVTLNSNDLIMLGDVK
ncbi:MAG: hypothetical protein WBG69_01725 [Arcobacteraceae bacterium]